MSKEPNERTKPAAPPRKPYKKPKLEEYGNLREITRHTGGAGNPDPPPHTTGGGTHG